MKKLFFVLSLSTTLFASAKTDYQNLLLEAERNGSMYVLGKQTAINQELPVSIYLKDQFVATAVQDPDGQLVYLVSTDFYDPLNNGFIASWNDIKQNYDLSAASINFGLGRIQNDHLANIANETNSKSGELLLITDSSADRVMSFDPATGDILNADFIPANASYFYTPLEAMSTPWNTVVVSDQVDDVVYEFASDGTYLGIFAPDGGVNNTILDNIRGIAFDSTGNLLVTVGGGANDDAVAMFDSAGNYLGNFIANGAGGIDSPFDVYFREADVLVTTSTSDMISIHDKKTGAFVSVFASTIAFPQQVTELDNYDVAVANFSSPNSGVIIYARGGGNYLRVLSQVTGLRGVYQLGNGNLVVTNGTGVFEINANSGAVVRTIVQGFSARFTGVYKESAAPVFVNAASQVNFGAVQGGSSATDSIWIKNEGSGDLVVTNVLTTNANFSSSVSNFTVAESDSYKLYIDYTAPIAAGIDDGYIIFEHNAPGSPDSIYVYADVITSIQYSGSEVPNKYYLGQNYPNPFNPDTKIEFGIPQTAMVSISIFDINGKMIKNLVQREFQPGSYELKFNGSELSTGTYFIKLSAGNSEFIKKMVLLK